MVYREAKYVYLTGGVVHEYRADASESHGDLVDKIEVAPITGGVSVKLVVAGKTRELMHLGGCTVVWANGE